MKHTVPRNLFLLASSVLLASSSNAYFQPQEPESELQSSSDNFIQTVIAPSCLLKDSTIKYKELGKRENFVLIQAGTQDLSLLREQKYDASCGGFLDVSAEWENITLAKNTKKPLSTQAVNFFAQSILLDELSYLKNQKQTLGAESNFKLSYPTQVATLLKLFDPQRLWQDLTVLTAFPDRYAASANGVKAAQWFKDQVESIAKANNRTDVGVRFVETGGSYKQPSVIVTILGTEPSSPGILVGGHMDTLNNNKPGADDDGSGAVTVLETLRVVLNSGMHFKRTVHFAWYAAEEQGLVGSRVVVTDFVTRNIALRGVLHFDMTGYQKENKNTIYLLSDNTNAEMTKIVADLATNYAKVDVAYTACGYACSDHASWTRRGIPSAAPFEAKFGEESPYIHTQNDTTAHISLEHMSRFAKVGIAFVGELADPV